MTDSSRPLGRVLIAAPDIGRAGDEAVRLLREAGCEIIPNTSGKKLTENDLIALIGDVDAVVAGTEPITVRVLDAARRLKIVARRGVGLDSVDVAAATARGIVVTVTAGALTDAVADHAIALLLAAARKITFLDRLVKSGGWDRLPSIQVSGRTLGIVGFGAIGRAVARRAQGFGMPILACDIIADTAAASALGVTLCDLDTVLASSDFVSLHVPLMPATRGLIGASALRRMKPTAILINTSRGPIVDEDALLVALREGRLAGAGLDVFQEEPTQNLDLVCLEQVVATPHVASHTAETMARMEQSCAESVVAALRGERPTHVVNAEAYHYQRA